MIKGRFLECRLPILELKKSLLSDFGFLEPQRKS